MGRLAPSIQFFELVYVLLGLLQMKWNFQTHEGRYLTNKGSAVGGFGVPQRRSRLKVLDMGENLSRVRFAQIHPVARG